MADQRRALIVANDEYEQEALRNLLAAAADAEALGRVLGDPRIGDFAVQVVRNEPAHVIQAQIEELFAESRSDDVLVLHFSGHGLKSESGELFFAASNTRPDRLGSTAVSADFVQRCMRDSRSRSVVLLLDCCYGGAFAQGVRVRAAGNVNVLDSFPQGRSGGGRGRAVITASSAMEFAFEGDQLGDDQQRRPSVFTTALVEGLATGDADRDEDGWVSLDELYDYVFDKVREQNPHQTPSCQFELEGELYLARSGRRRIRPAPLPADLQAASEPATPVPGEAPWAVDGRQRLARESAMSRPQRHSGAPSVWAAGSAVLSVVLFFTALQVLVTSSSVRTALWQIVLGVAVLGVLIVGFDRPFKRLRTFVHGWNLAWSISVALFILEVHAEGGGFTDQITAWLAIGAVGNAISAAFAFVLTSRDDRGDSNMILSITAGLLTVAFLVLAVGEVNMSAGFIRGGSVVLFAASFTSLLQSVVVLAGSSRSRTGTGA